MAGHDDSLAGDQGDDVGGLGGGAGPPGQCPSAGHHPAGEEQAGDQAGPARDALH